MLWHADPSSLHLSLVRMAALPLVLPPGQLLDLALCFPLGSVTLEGTREACDVRRVWLVLVEAHGKRGCGRRCPAWQVKPTTQVGGPSLLLTAPPANAHSGRQWWGPQ